MKLEYSITVFPFLEFFNGKDDEPEHFLSASEESDGEPGADPDSLMRMGMIKAGQNQGANVTCKRWTSRLVTVGRSLIKR